jgi:WD40 repeat protein
MIPCAEPPRSVGFLDAGRLLAIQTRSSVRLCSVGAGTTRLLPLAPGTIPVTVAYSPASGATMAVATQTNVFLFVATTGRMQRLPLPAGEVPNHLVFSGDGRVLLLASPHVLRLWDVAGAALRDRSIRTPQEIEGVTCSRNGEVLAAWGGRTAWVWSARTGKLVGTPLDHGAELRSVVFSGAGQAQVMTTSSDRIRFWDARTGRSELSPLVSPGGMGLVAADLTRARLAASVPGPIVRIWKISAARLPVRLMRSETLQDACFAPGGNELLTADLDTCRVWDPALGVPRGTARPLLKSGYRAAFSDDARLVATAGTGTVRLWEVQSGRMTVLPGKVDGRETCLSVSPRGRWVAVGTSRPGAQIWDAATGRAGFTSLTLHAAPRRFAFSDDERFLVSTGQNSLEVSDLATHLSISPLFLDERLLWAGFVPGGSVLIAASGTRLFRWDLARAGSHPDSLSLPALIRAVTIDPSGRRLAVSTADQLVRMCDLVRLRISGSPLRHTDRVHALAFSPNGELLVTCQGGSRVVLWDLHTEQPCGRPLDLREDVLRLEFHPTGSSLAIRTSNAMYLWRIPVATDSFDRMQQRTWLSLDTRDTSRGVEAIPAAEWCQLRDRLR